MYVPPAPAFILTTAALAFVLAIIVAFGTDVSSRYPGELPRYRRIRVYIDCLAASAFVSGVLAFGFAIYKPQSAYLLYACLMGLLGGAWASFAHAPAKVERVVFDDTSRCQKCGYPSRGVRSDRCPECGELYPLMPYRYVPSRLLRVCVILGGLAMLAIAGVVLYFCITWKPPT